MSGPCGAPTRRRSARPAGERVRRLVRELADVRREWTLAMSWRPVPPAAEMCRELLRPCMDWEGGVKRKVLEHDDQPRAASTTVDGFGTDIFDSSGRHDSERDRDATMCVRVGLIRDA